MKTDDLTWLRSLDEEANTNLTRYADRVQYLQRRQEVLDMDIDADEARLILTGFIWDLIGD